jgi:amino-acid N-acetyltransferase
LAAVRRLLTLAGLPSEDVTGESELNLIVAEQQHEVVGAAGIEANGSFGLLRSVVVAEKLRGMGLGRALVDERLRWAAEEGLAALYLLTIDAEDYFSNYGFRAIQRDQVPPEIQRTSEYESLCPDTAAVMVLKLANPAGEEERRC